MGGKTKEDMGGRRVKGKRTPVLRIPVAREKPGSPTI